MRFLTGNTASLPCSFSGGKPCVCEGTAGRLLDPDHGGRTSDSRRNRQAVDRLDAPITWSVFEPESVTPAQPIRDAERMNKKDDLVDQAVIGSRDGE